MRREHIIGAAQTEYFGPVSNEPDIHHWYQAGPDAPVESRKSAARFAMFARKACRECNNGSMRTLDDQLEPVLREFARKRPIRIDLPTQQRLARWALKISLLTMTQDPEETQFARGDHYRHVYETDAPPDGYQLWLGQTNAVELVSAQSQSLACADAFPRRAAQAATSRVSAFSTSEATASGAMIAASPGSVSARPPQRLRGPSRGPD